MIKLRPIVFLAALAAGATPAQQAPPLPEAHAFELKERAQQRDAELAFLALLEAASGVASEAGSGELTAARASFHATMAHLLAARIGDFALIARLRATAAGELARAHPFLRDHCLHLALDLARQHGDLAVQAELTADLGYLTRWYVIGPFDNERGSGFGRAAAPVTSFDLDATYDGKKRSVAWRPLPVASPPGGIVDLDAMVRPNDQVLCYAATALVAAADADIALHLGSDEAFKVFLNGAEVAARDVRRRFAPDQDAVVLRLHAGANLLVLQVCEQEGEFEFAARLRALDGTPVAGVTASDAKGDLAAAARTAPVALPAPEMTPGAEAVLQRSVDATGDAADAMRLAMLLAMEHGDDVTERRDHELARKAVAGLPDLPAARYLLAFTRVREGQAEEKDENPRRRDYEQLLAARPDNVEALRSLAELELETAGAATRAAALCEQALRANPDAEGVRLVLADAYERLDLGALARPLLERAAAPDADGRRAPRALARWFAHLVREEDWRAADRLAPEALAASFDAGTVVAVAGVALRVGDRARGKALLERAAVELPFAREPRLRLARLLEAEGDLDAALRVLGDWLVICPEDDETLVEVARLHGRRGDVERQRETLRTVVELNPNQKSERRHLEFLIADEVPFYAAYAIDSATAAGDGAKPPEGVAASNDPFYYLLQHDVVRAYRNGTTSHYHHGVVRVLSDQGARELASFVVPYFGGEQRARLLEVRIVKPDGQELRPRLSGAFTRMPPLAPGDLCEIRYRVDDLAPSFFGDYFGHEHRFAADDGCAVRWSVLDLVLDPGRDYSLQTSNGAPEATKSQDDGATAYRFEMRDLPRRALEELRPDLDETEPLVRVTTYRDWNAFSTWWWNLIRKQTEMTAEMNAKVRELTAGLGDDVARIEAIYRFVTTDIHYRAWEFGVHGYQPYSTPVIFERRHGDCKDKALLLNAMLGAIGVEAYPVLIHADPRRSADDLSLPLVQHFNHCISYLPAAGGRPEMFLDGTATYHALDTTPEMDQGAHVLVVRKEQGELHTVPWTPAAANLDRRTFDVALDASGSAVVTLVHEPLRNQAVAVREALGNEPAKRKERIEAELTGLFGSVEVLSVETSDLLDLGAPVRVTVRFRCPEFAARQDGALVLKPGFAGEPMQVLASAAQRQNALLLGAPWSSEQSVTYHLPPDFAPLELPPPVQLDTRFGAFGSAWTAVAPNTLRVERTQQAKSERVEPQEYPEFREFAADVDRADRRFVLAARRGQ